MHLTSSDLTTLSSHFAFGKNWESYAELIDETRIREAEHDLERLIGTGAIRGRHFLDIGCGSGLHALAAARLGAAKVTAIDIDPISVATAEALFVRHAPDAACDIHVSSILEGDETTVHDIVYSWGVLHHTGAMYRALEQAAALVKPGGIFVFALYRKTRLGPIWMVIKRWYSNASPAAQARARTVYLLLMRLRFHLAGRDYAAYIRDYKGSRGMDFLHDVHDWMGGYPYEEISESQVDALMQKLGFRPEARWVEGLQTGLLGSGCDEYVFRRPE